MLHQTSPHRRFFVTTETAVDTNVSGQQLFDTTLSEQLFRRHSEMSHHPSPHRLVMMTGQSAVEMINTAQQLIDAGLVVVPDGEFQLTGLNMLLLNYLSALRTGVVPSTATLDLTLGTIDHIQQRHWLSRHPVVVGHDLATTYPLSQREWQFVSLPLDRHLQVATTVHSSPITSNNNVFEVGDRAVAVDQESMRRLEMHHHPSPHRPTMVTTQYTNAAAALGQQRHDTGFNMESNREGPLVDAAAVHSSPITINNNVFEVGDRAVTVDQESMRRLEMHHHPSPHRRTMVTTQYTNVAAALGQQRHDSGFNMESNREGPLVDAAAVHSSPITINNNVFEVGDRAVAVDQESMRRLEMHHHPSPHRPTMVTTQYTNAVAALGQQRHDSGFNMESNREGPLVDAAGGGWHRNVWASASRLFRGRGGANNPFWMSLRRELRNTLRILGIGDINNLKGGSFALSLIPFFVDKQPPLNAQDTIYMRIAFWCGVSAFLIVPLRVPGAESTPLARNRQVVGVTTLITGAIIFMVTAVDEKQRLLVLFLILACILFSVYLEKREANETQLLPL